MNQDNKILIIGLDGFTWKVGDNLVAEGYMPTLCRLSGNGCHGKLKSVMPFETAPAWSSFQTGCYPNNTGIFSFHTFDTQTNQVRLNSFCDIRIPTLWELLSDHDKKVICLNMPVTSPPPPIKGVMVPGLLCPGFSSESIHPSDVYSRYIKPSRNYQIVNNNYCQTIDEFARQSCITEKARCEVALELMEDHDWDLFCVQMQSTDLFQHRYWWAMDPDANGYTDQDHQTAITFYKTCDEIIRKLIDKAGQDTTVFIASDHGFTSQRYSLAVNRWLLEKGYLHLQPKEKNSWQRTKEAHPFLKGLAQGYGKVRQTATGLKEALLGKVQTPFSEIELTHLREQIDFDRSAAFCLGAMGGIVYLNPSAGDRDAVSANIKKQLLKEFGPTSHIPLIQSIKSGTEEYGTPLEGVTLPDLVIAYTEGVSTVINPRAAETVTDYSRRDRQPGTHARDGILVAHGKGIKQDCQTHADIVDIVPTVLASMGLPVPRHIDGKVLSDLFENPPEVHYTDAAIKKGESVHYSDEEQSEVEKRLADLGYL